MHADEPSETLNLPSVELRRSSCDISLKKGGILLPEDAEELEDHQLEHNDIEPPDLRSSGTVSNAHDLQLNPLANFASSSNLKNLNALNNLARVEIMNGNDPESINVLVKQELEELNRNSKHLSNLPSLNAPSSANKSMKPPYFPGPESVLGHPSLDPTVSNAKKQKLTRGEPRRTWQERSACVFVHLHAKIGSKDYAKSSNIVNVSANTLRGWLTKVPLMQKWIPFLQDMTAADAAKILDIDLNDFEVETTEMVDCAHFVNILAKKNIPLVRIKNGQKRVQSNPRCSKWYPQFLFLRDAIHTAWEHHFPVSVRSLRDMLHAKYLPIASTSSKEEKDPTKLLEDDQDNKFFDRYLRSNGRNHPTTVNTLITRMIQRSGYSLRDKRLIPMLPVGWKETAKAFATDFSDWYWTIQADCIVASDEMFIGGSEEIARAQARVSSDGFPRRNDTFGCTVVVSCCLPEGKLLQPLLITNQPDEVALEASMKMTGIQMAANESYIMTAPIMKTLMKSILLQNPGKNVAWVLDTHSAHSGVEFEQALKEVNDDTGYPGTLHVMHIKERLSSTLHVPEEFLLERLRPRIKLSVDDQLVASHQQSFECDGVPRVAETTLKEFVSQLLAVFQSFNEDERDVSDLKKSFSRCGQNPYDNNANAEFLERFNEFGNAADQRQQQASGMTLSLP